MTESVDRWLSSSRFRLWGGLFFLIALVSWLFFKAQGGAPLQAFDYQQSLRRLQQADFALNAAVLASHSNIAKNYDAIVEHLAEVRAERNFLAGASGGVAPEFLPRLQERVSQLLLVLDEKEADIENFKRLNSVLRNAEYYLMNLTDELEDDAVINRSFDFDHLIRHLLTFQYDSERRSSELLTQELNRVRQLRPASPDARLALSQLIRHAEILVSETQSRTLLLRKIVGSPTAKMIDEISEIQLGGRAEGQRVAAYYRACLYALTLLLAIYLIRLLLRVEGARLALEHAHRNLEARYEAQRRAEEELRLYGTVFKNAREGMTITDTATRIIAVNPAFSEITGYSPDEVIGKTPAVLNSGRQGPDFYRRMWEALRAEGRWHGEIWNRRKDGKVFPEWLSIVAVHDEVGDITHYIGVFTDVSEHKRNEARISHLASHDALTGLPNRALLEERISEGMKQSKRRGSVMALLFIDLDRFKNINDTLGHETGDQLLTQAAERALSVLRPGDTLSRVGGDEFVAVLPELETRQQAAELAIKLLGELCRPYLLAGHELTVSGSVGIALYPDDGHTVSDLLRKADAAMYRAKEEGRNTFRYFSAEVSRVSLEELLLEQELRGALERDELEMYYEPKVEARSGRIIAAEALMRWRHRDKGLVSPALFIPLAEKIGLIHLFGEWALRDVCRQLRDWRDAGLPIVPVAVNISAQQFAQQDLPTMIGEILNEYRLSPAELSLELTESMLMRDSQRAAEVLEQLRKIGIKVAIDDFGVGYSSLSYLKQFPVSTLKIDRSFVCEIDESGEEVKLAAAIIAMAHELDLIVVAEGVEEAVQRDYLVAHGCDQLQGYFFSRPQPAEKFAEMLRSGQA